VQRFSSFSDLVHRMLRDRSIVEGEAGRCLEGWRTRLLLEKRHSGSRARASDIVSGRVALLQRLLDDLCSFVELSQSPELLSFLGLLG